MILYAAIFIIFLVNHFELTAAFINNANTTQESMASALAQTAKEGASVYEACSASSLPAGQYSEASLNIGASNDSPLGNEWGCVKTTGGLYGGLITIVTFINPPSHVPGESAISPLAQQNLAYQISEDLINLVQFQANTIVGTIPAGSLDMSLLAPSGQSLPVLEAGLTYSTPAIVGNLYATTPTNNQTVPAP